MKVETNKITDWLNNQIKGYKLSSEIISIGESYSESIMNIGIYGDNRIHISSAGMLEISCHEKFAGCVKIEERNDADYPYQAFLLYKGFTFFALLTEHEYLVIKNQIG